jgi:hypothetical protein
VTAEELKKCAQEKSAVLINACDLAAKHYDDYYKAFVALDGKAQGVATISGLVLAAIAAFLKDGRVPILAQRGYLWMFLILAAPVTALLAVIISLWGAKVTEIVEPFDAPNRISEAEELAKLDCDQFTQGHVVNYYLMQLERWRECLGGTGNTRGIKDSVDDKARCVLIGQRLMIAALALLIVLFATVLYVSGSTVPAKS